MDKRLKRGGQGQIDESLRVKLMLAGLYAKRAPILLLVTNRPSHMRACDRIIRLEHGMIVTDGATEQMLGG